MTLPATLQYLEPLLDVLVEMALEDLRVAGRENGDESGQEQRRRGDQTSGTVSLPDMPREVRR